MQREDRVGRLLGDQPHHPLVGLGQFAFVDVLAQRDVVVHAFVEVLAVVGDRVGERRVERVEDAGQFVVGAAPALPQLFAFLLDRGEQRVAVRFGIEQFQADRQLRGVAVQQLGQRLGHERGGQPLLEFQQPGAALVEAVAAGLDRAAARHELLDLRPAFVGARVERFEVGVVGHQQLVLFAQPVGVPVGGLGVDLAPLRVLLADRLARRRPVAPLLALGGDVVGGAAGLLVGLLGGGQFERSAR